MPLLKQPGAELARVLGRARDGAGAGAGAGASFSAPHPKNPSGDAAASLPPPHTPPLGQPRARPGALLSPFRGPAAPTRRPQRLPSPPRSLPAETHIGRRLLPVLRAAIALRALPAAGGARHPAAPHGPSRPTLARSPPALATGATLARLELGGSEGGTARLRAARGQQGQGVGDASAPLWGRPIFPQNAPFFRKTPHFDCCWPHRACPASRPSPLSLGGDA